MGILPKFSRFFLVTPPLIAFLDNVQIFQISQLFRGKKRINLSRFFLVTSPVNYFIISSFNSWAEGTIRLGVYITDRLSIICTDWESLNQLKRNFSAKS